MAIQANFGEQIIPAAISRVDASGLTLQGFTTSGNIGIVGIAKAGDEDVVYEFQSANEAKSIFQGGAMLDCIETAYRAGAQRMFAVRCGSPTAATEDFTASGNADAMTVTAANKGTGGNAIEVKVTDGSPASKRILTIRHQDNYNNVLETYDDDGTGYATMTALLAAVTANTNSIAVVTMDEIEELPLAAAWTSLAAGTDGTRTTLEISDALDLLLAQNVDIIILDTADDTYHTVALGHCIEASNALNRSERTCVLGMILAKSVSEYTTAASNLNNKRAVLVAPCLQTPDFGIGGMDKSLKDGHIGAAGIAGLKAAQNDPAEPLTRKAVSFSTGLENEYSNSQLESLISGNVLPIGKMRKGGNVVMMQQTTSSDNGFEEWSVVTLIDYCMKDLREMADELFVGEKGIDGILELVEATFKARLRAYVEQRIIFSFWADSVDAQFLDSDQRWINISFSAIPVMPVNVVAITGAFSSIFNFNLRLAVGG